MLIISQNIKLSQKDIAILSNKQLIISNVITAYGSDDTHIAIEKLMNKMNNIKNN